MNAHSVHQAGSSSLGGAAVGTATGRPLAADAAMSHAAARARIDLVGRVAVLLILVLTLLGLPAFQSSSLAANSFIGSQAPYFRVQSGDDKELTLDVIRGKVATIFYENKDIIGANQRLKDELKRLYANQTDALRDLLVRLPVIDCSDAAWPIRWLWKRKLREYSKREGMRIYCDWDGKMSADYKMKADVSNVVIIDKVGKIRFFSAGEVKDAEISGIKELLKALAGE